MAKIKVFREKAWADSLVKYKIIIDGKEIDVIKQDETKVLEVGSGDHEIYLKIAFCRSRKINFNVVNTSEARFRCKGLTFGESWFYLFIVLLFFTRYIKLEKVDSGDNLQLGTSLK